MASDARHIKFLALCCSSKVLASHTHWNKEAAENYDQTLRQVFSSQGWASIQSQKKSKLELKSGSNVYLLELDIEGRVYAAVVTAAYPTRHIFSASGASGAGSSSKLMRDFREHVQSTLARESLSSPEGGLQRTLSRFLESLAVKYDDLEAIDKVVKVQAQVAGVQTTMVRNLTLADERQSLLDRQLDKSRQLDASSRALFSRTQTLRRRACLARYRSCCWMLCIALLVAAIVAATVVGLNYSKYHWWG